MDKQEFDKRLNDAIGVLTKTMTESFEQPQPYKRWRADVDEPYWRLGGECPVISMEAFDDIDDIRYATGNYFKTEAEAETNKQHLLATQELKDLAEGYEVDFGREVYQICFDGFNFEPRVDNVSVNDGVYFQTEFKAQHAIDTLGETKLKLIFEVV